MDNFKNLIKIYIEFDDVDKLSDLKNGVEGLTINYTVENKSLLREPTEIYLDINVFNEFKKHFNKIQSI